jgi:hypothetical protein
VCLRPIGLQAALERWRWRWPEAGGYGSRAEARGAGERALRGRAARAAPSGGEWLAGGASGVEQARAGGASKQRTCARRRRGAARGVSALGRGAGGTGAH